MTDTLAPQATRLEKIPPQNLEAETAVLGAMLFDEQAVPRAIELVREAHFHLDAHQKIFRAVVTLFEKAKAIDLVTVSEELRKQRTLEEAGGSAYLAELTSQVPTAANVEHYARIVREKAILRHLINAATGIIQESFEAASDANTVLDHAERAIFEISQAKVESRAIAIKDIIKDSIEAIDRLYQRKEHVTGLATGYYDLDMKTAGFQASDLVIIAGRPSMGKSALACCIAEHAAVVQGKPVAFFSLEMSKEQLVQRFLCAHAKVDAQKVRTGYLAHTDWPKLTSAAGRLSEAPLFIDDTPTISILDLRAKARRMKSQHDIQVIIVDYLQLMQGRGKSENRQQEISEISSSLKALARELNVPLVAISQLSRAVESRTGNRPQLSDLRESGAIEQDADLVLFVFREEYYNPTEENRNKADVIIAKQRNGPVGSVDLVFVKEWTRFENPEFHRSEEVLER
jgi:replicative DNA helicase